MSGTENLARWYFWGSVVATVGSGILFLSFLFQKTASFEALNLSDPSIATNPAGWWLGLIISAILTAAMIWGCRLFQKHVLAQIAAFGRVREAWSKETADLKAGIGRKEDAFENLTKAAGTEHSRVREVLISWDDASPDSDAEYVIEGQAAPCRQQLAVLQTIASILVLIGLVGNFFGLADAVQRLPDLTAASAKQTAATSPLPAQTQSNLKTESTTTDGVTAYETKAQSDAPETISSDPDVTDDPLAVPIKGISEGLSVVVVSSVMGIGGMAILLLFVAGFKSIFNSIVTEEIVLMGAEIGSLLRPSGGSGGLTEEAQQAILTLPGRIEKFDKAAQTVTETFGKSSGDLQAIAKSLDELMRHEMVEAKGAHETYQKSLTQFTNVLMDERKTLESLMSRTNSLCDGMEKLAQSVQTMAQTTQDTATNYQETQAKYESYLRLVTDLAEKRNKEFDRKIEADNETLQNTFRELSDNHNRLTEELIERTEAALGSAGTALGENTTDALRHFEEEFSKRLEARHTAEIDALHDVLASQKQSLEAVSSEVAAVSQKNLEIARDTVSQTQERLLDVCDRVAETQNAALRSVVDYWTRELGGFSDSSVAKLEEGFHNLIKRLEESSLAERAAEKDGKALGAEALEELKSLVSRLSTLEIPKEITLSESSIGQLQRHLSIAASAPTNGSEAVDTAALTAAVASQAPQKVEISETAEQKIADSITKALASGLKPLTEAVQNSDSPRAGTWFCNVCSASNSSTDRHCSDCGASKEQALKATPIPPSIPNLQEYVTGLEEVLRRELQPLVETLRKFVERETEVDGASSPSTTELTLGLQELKNSTERALQDLRDETKTALATANESLQRIAGATSEKIENSTSDKELVDTLQKLTEQLKESPKVHSKIESKAQTNPEPEVESGPKPEPDVEAQPEADMSSKPGFLRILGFGKSRGRK